MSSNFKIIGKRKTFFSGQKLIILYLVCKKSTIQLNAREQKSVQIFYLERTKKQSVCLLRIKIAKRSFFKSWNSNQFFCNCTSFYLWVSLLDDHWRHLLLLLLRLNKLLLQLLWHLLLRGSRSDDLRLLFSWQLGSCCSASSEFGGSKLLKVELLSFLGKKYKLNISNLAKGRVRF